MPIINPIIQGGGTTPTGTLSITNNGTYDVTNYASADVNVPTTAPARYIKLMVDVDNVLGHDGGSVPDLTGVARLSTCVFAYTFGNANTLPASTTIDFSNIAYFDAYCLAGAFATNTNLVGKISIGGVVHHNAFDGAFIGTGVTEVEINQLAVTTDDTYAFRQAFANCSSLIKVTINSTTIPSGNYTFVETFNNSAISTLDVSAVTTISGGSTATAAGHSYMFGNLANLSSVTWTSLTSIARNAFNGMFYGSAITSMSFPAVTTSSFQHNQALASMLAGVANCTLHFPSNVQATVEALSGYSTTAPFGATAGTVLFDLPATE